MCNTSAEDGLPPPGPGGRGVLAGENSDEGTGFGVSAWVPAFAHASGGLAMSRSLLNRGG